MAILTLSRTYGCGAREMARELAKELDYNVFEKEMVQLLSRRLNKRKEYTVEHDELRDKFSSSVIDLASSRFAFLKKDFISPQEYTAALREIFTELLHKDNVIVIGRGAQFILQKSPGVYHVRLIASVGDRVKHLKQYHFLEFSDNTLIQRILDEDHRRQEFLKTHFNETGEDPLIYHLTINLSKVSRKKAQEMILQLIT